MAGVIRADKDATLGWSNECEELGGDLLSCPDRMQAIIAHFQGGDPASETIQDEDPVAQRINSTAETHQLCGDPTAAKGWLLNCLEASAWLIATTLKGVAAGTELVAKTTQSFITAAALGPLWPDRTTVPGFHEKSRLRRRSS